MLHVLPVKGEGNGPPAGGGDDVCACRGCVIRNEASMHQCLGGRLLVAHLRQGRQRHLALSEAPSTAIAVESSAPTEWQVKAANNPLAGLND